MSLIAGGVISALAAVRAALLLARAREVPVRSYLRLALRSRGAGRARHRTVLCRTRHAPAAATGPLPRPHRRRAANRWPPPR